MAAERVIAARATSSACGFNEAAAKWPRKARRVRSNLATNEGFNEAAAKWPRKGAEGQREGARAHASMRPRPNGRGKPHKVFQSFVAHLLQ
jgi:hypothetical protein